MFQLRPSDSGPFNEANAYGEIVSTKDARQPLPLICGHGGSMWLCRSCKDKILASDRKEVREATAAEAAWFKIPP